MKIKYDKETDVIYIQFSDDKIEESIENKPGIIIDYNQTGDVVAIEILNASAKMESPGRVIYEDA